VVDASPVDSSAFDGIRHLAGEGCRIDLAGGRLDAPEWRKSITVRLSHAEFDLAENPSPARPWCRAAPASAGRPSGPARFRCGKWARHRGARTAACPNGSLAI
jgi:hypothetical protein